MESVQGRRGVRRREHPQAGARTGCGPDCGDPRWTHAQVLDAISSGIRQSLPVLGSSEPPVHALIALLGPCGCPSPVGGSP